MELVIFLDEKEEGKGQILALIKNFECEKIFVVKSGSTKNPFKDKKIKEINVNTSKDIVSLKNEICEKLRKEKIGDFEVALSLASGGGKEHMALISALLSIPVGIKLVVYTKNGIEFLT